MSESHSDVADNDAVLDIKATGSTGLGLAYGDILNAEDITDIRILNNLSRVIRFGIVTELLDVLLFGPLGLPNSRRLLLIAVYGF